MRSARTLRLRREVLAELGAADLDRVAAGQAASVSPTCPPTDCVTLVLTLFVTCATVGSCLSCRPSCEC